MASTERKENSKNTENTEKVFPWHLGVFDAHCHPTDILKSIDNVPLMQARALTIMASRSQDQHIVAHFAETHGMTHASISAVLQVEGEKRDTQCQIVPSFGWHPWFSHEIYDDSLELSNERLQGANKILHYKAVIYPEPSDDGFLSSLPDPQPLSSILAQTREYLERFQYALVGEVGLDHAFRIPDHRLPDIAYERDSSLTPGGREGKRLTSYRVRMDHQRAILKAQLDLAGELSRAVSVHGVAAHGALFEVLRETWKGSEKKVISNKSKKRNLSVDNTHLTEDDVEAEGQALNLEASKPLSPRVCLHSYSGPPDLIKRYLHPSVPAVIFFSFSRLVNFSSPASPKAIEVIKIIPNDRILVESDLHCAGQHMDDLLEQITRSVCHIKNWSLDEGIKQLASNWSHFVFKEKA